MKAWLPKLTRPNVVANKLATDIRTLPGSTKLRSAATSHQPPQRNYHGPSDSRASSLAEVNGVRSYFSLAEKIREFLPGDVFEEDNKDNESVVLLQPELERDLEDWCAHTSLAAYESEIYIAEKLAKTLEFKDLVNFIVANMPLQVALTALVERIAPIIKKGPLGDVGIIELAYYLYSKSNYGLAQHYLQAIGVANEIWPFELVSLLVDASTQPSVPTDSKIPIMSSKKVDLIVNGLCPDLHFPQFLSQEDKLNIDDSVSIWLKMRVLSMLPWNECEKWLNRYFGRLAQRFTGKFLTQSHVVAFLGSNIAEFGMFSRWALKDQDNVVPLISVTRTPTELHSILRPLLRPTKLDDVETETVTALLKAALRQRQSYDVANICRSFNTVLIETKEKQALLADALLAVAFAQKMPTPKNEQIDVENENITMPSDSLKTPLMTMVLPSDSNIASAVIGNAAWKLQARYKRRKVPGRVLWQLLSSLPHQMSLSSYAQSELAKLVVLRPYIEQVRFMALPFISKKGLRHLLQWHVNKIIDYRRRNQVNWNTLQAKEDVQLLIVGAAIAAEKAGLSLSGGLQASIITNFEDNNLTISSISDYKGHIFIDQLMKTTTSVSAWLILQITAELIANKNYMVAQQMLRMLGRRLAEISFDKTLLRLVETHPSECYYFVLWLLSERLPVRPIAFSTLDRLLLVLIKEPSLSESQIMNRFQTLRGVIGSKMRREISMECAANFVDALIESSKLRNGGSRQRLKWALEIAHKAGVPDIYFENWTSELQKMNANKIGFWYGTQ